MTGSENAAQILANVAALGFRVEDIEILLASHAHFDHTGGMAEVKERTGAHISGGQFSEAPFSKALLWLSAAGAELGSTGGKGNFHFGDALAYPAVAADHILEHSAPTEEPTVELGGHSLTALLTPEHIAH